MIAKKTSNNQITLPKKIVEKLPDAEYFDIRLEKGAIVLRPVLLGQADRVREKLVSLGISEADVRRAVEWARGKKLGESR